MSNIEAFEAQRVLINLFERWKGYELPDLNSDNQFDKEWLHREWVAFQAGHKLALASQAQQESQWISVDERLPEIGEEVIVFKPKSTRQKVTALARLIRYEEDPSFYWATAYGANNATRGSSVTHWMPLPPAPEGGDK